MAPKLRSTTALFFASASIGFLVSGCSHSVAMAPSAVSSFTPMPEDNPDKVRAESASRMKQLGLANIRYMDRHNGQFADLSSATNMQTALRPFLKEDPVGGEEIFVEPLSGQSYIPNPLVGKANLDKISNPEKTVLFYEPVASANATRGVVFCDGHFSRLGESDWEDLKVSSKIP